MDNCGSMGFPNRTCLLLLGAIVMKLRSQGSICILVLLSTLVAVPLSVYAQNSPSPQKDDTPRVLDTLRTNTRLVAVDVVVTDTKAQPVRDLEAEDFTMLEAAAPQKISGLTFHHPGDRRGAAAKQLPPNVVPNAP